MNAIKLNRFLDTMLVHFFRFSNKLHARLARLALRRGLSRAIVEIPLDLRANGVRPPAPNQCSFRVEIISHSRSWLEHRDRWAHPEWTLDNKLDAYRFMSMIDVLTPKIFFSDKGFDEADIVPNSVLKPEAGYLSHGVFVLDAQGAAREVATRQQFTTPKELRARMHYLLEKGRVEEDRWYAEAKVESAAGNIAPDVKFYTFYGEVPLALKVDRNGPANVYETIDENGKKVNTGYYKVSALPHIKVTEAMFAEAARISRLIPSPFLRLDFLLGETLVFGEIGNMVGGNALFSNSWDRRLGDAFARARGRLYEDLRSEHIFADYDRFLNDTPAHPKTR